MNYTPEQVKELLEMVEKRADMKSRDWTYMMCTKDGVDFKEKFWNDLKTSTSLTYSEIAMSDEEFEQHLKTIKT